MEGEEEREEVKATNRVASGGNIQQQNIMKTNAYGRRKYGGNYQQFFWKEKKKKGVEEEV